MLTKVTVSLLVCVLWSSCVAFRPGQSRSVLKERNLAPSSSDAHIRTARLSRRLNRTVIVVIDCETVPCKNNATCHHESHCECAPGWTGQLCDKKAHNCIPFEQTTITQFCYIPMKLWTQCFTQNKSVFKCYYIYECSKDNPLANIVYSFIIVTQHNVKFGFETYLGMTNDVSNDVNFRLVTYSEYTGRGTEGNSYVLVESSTSCHYHSVLYSDPVYTEKKLEIVFDYTTFGSGSLDFHVFDLDSYGSYLLHHDSGNNGVWKSFNTSIAGGHNVEFYFSAVTGGYPKDGSPLNFQNTYGAAAIDNLRFTFEK